MKRIVSLLILIALSASASAQRTPPIKSRYMLPVLDANTKVEQPFAAYQDICLGDTPAIMVFAVGPDSMMKPVGVISWPADKPNPCRGGFATPK